jgi:hypothetical protein
MMASVLIVGGLQAGSKTSTVAGAGPTRRELVLEDNRRRFWQRRIASVQAYQSEGKLAAHIDSEQLTFFL